MVLGKPGLSTWVTQARASADGTLCIVGETMDPDGDLQTRGVVILYSIAANRVLWQQAGLAWVYRFGPEGKVLAQAELHTGAPNAFAYDIDAGAGGVTVAGRTTAKRAQPQANAIFFARLDPAFKSAAFDRLTTGAWLGGAVVRLNGSTAWLGGNFAPVHAAADALADDYAVSKIVAGKYQFSVRSAASRWRSRVARPSAEAA